VEDEREDRGPEARVRAMRSTKARAAADRGAVSSVVEEHEGSGREERGESDVVEARAGSGRLGRGESDAVEGREGCGREERAD